MKIFTQTRWLLNSIAMTACVVACVSVPQASSNSTPSTDAAVDAQPVQAPSNLTPDLVSNEPVRPTLEPPVQVEPVAEKKTLDERWKSLMQGDLPTLLVELDQADSETLMLLVDQPISPAQQAAHLRLAMVRLHEGVVIGLPQTVPTELSQALERTRKLSSQLNQSRPRRVGLLLPQDRAWGKVLDQAFRFGLGESSVELFAASSEDPEAGMRQLILEHGVSLVICGPFLKRAHRAAVVAQLFNVPMISLAREPGLAELGDAIFQVGLTNEAQIDRLVAGAMELRGYKNFAVLFPRTASGWTALERFTAQVEARGGKVSRSQPYLRGETSFTPLITSMVGRDAAALNANPKYRKCVSEIAKHHKGLRRKRQVESCRDHTPPKIDFDAIFVPDSVSTVRQIMPFIELADMVPNLNERMLWRTRKATSNKDLIATPILGMRQLNSIFFASRSRTDVEGSLFVDAYYPYDKSRALPGVFTRAFRKAFSRPPDLLETLAYDLGLLVAHFDSKELLSSRMIVKGALSNLKGFETVTGPWTMGPQGQVQRPLYLLSIHKRRILTESDRVQALTKKKSKKRRRGR